MSIINVYKYKQMRGMNDPVNNQKHMARNKIERYTQH